MNFYLEGFRQDLKLEEENIENFYREYLHLNQIFASGQNKYEEILLGYGTEELKFTLGFLTSIIKNIEKKSYHVIDSVFDSIEHSGNFDLSVFYGNRIIEKFSSSSPEEFLIRIYTLRRMLNALLILDDRLYYVKYLLDFIKQISDFYDKYPTYIKENLKNAMDFYQFMYIYALKLHSDEEKALGYLIKGYNLKKYMIEEKIIPYPQENNIFQIINIVGSYLQIEDSFIALVLDIDDYIREFVIQVKDLKEYAIKKPAILEPYLQNPFKKYINQFLTNIYILGFEEEYRQVAEELPQILTRDHSLIVKINEIVMKENFKEKKLISLKEEMERAFNNLSDEKKENVLYVYYNGFITVFRDNIDEIQKARKELESHIKKLKNPYSLNVPLFRILNILGKKEEARRLAEETKQQAIISGKKFLANAIDDYIQLEL
ncbi:hypothetical protein [Persephonella sp.]